MRHYSESQWLAYKNHMINRLESANMEDHLLECDECLSLFLSLADELDEARANKVIPPNFSRNTMAFIHQNQTRQSGTMRSRDKIKRLLAYYVVASAVTLMLVSSGFFEKVVSDVSMISAYSTINVEKPDNIIYTWPNRLIETSSSWTQLITNESKNIEEVLR